MTGKKLVQVPLKNGKILWLEVEEAAGSQSGRVPVSRLSTLQEKVVKTFEDALESTKEAAESIIDKMSELKNSPQEIELEFGIKLTSELDAVISSASAEGNFKVVLKWKKEQENE